MNNNYKINRLLVAILTILLLTTTSVQARETRLVSVSSKGVQGNDDTGLSIISSDGCYLAFISYASNLVSGDSNGLPDVFVRDCVTCKTRRVSVSSAGTQGNGPSYSHAISADGRFVAFDSFADNLVAGDTNGDLDIFVHDRVTGKTTRVSVSSKGVQGNRGSFAPSISADGRYVAFSSLAFNLFAGGINLPLMNAFVHDRVTGSTTLVNLSSEGVQAYGEFNFVKAISADGRYVLFDSDASNLGEDTNGSFDDVYVRDRVTGTTTRVSVSSAGAQGNGESGSTAISADGRYVVFRSTSDNLVAEDTNGVLDAFVRDRVTGTTTRVSVSSEGVQGNGDSYYNAAISADGRYVTFDSKADNLVAGDTNGVEDIFVHDRVTGKTTRVSVSSKGVQGNGDSRFSFISADGRYVAFPSSSNNLVAGDTNGFFDAFVHDRLLDKAHQADLQATVVVKPVSIRRGQTASYKLKIKNNGPNSASDLSLTDIVFNGTVAGITPSRSNATCSKAAVSVCRLPILAAGENITFIVKIRAIAKPLRQQFIVRAAPRDNAPNNNVINVRTSVTP